jgi:hypothetical protein
VDEALWCRCGINGPKNVARSPIQLAPVKWATLSSVWRTRAREVLETEAGDKLDQAFIDRLHAQRSSTEKLFWRISVVQTVFLLALFLNAIVLPAEVSIGGLTAKQVGAMKEILLFISATLAIFQALLGAERQAIGIVCQTWAHRHFPPQLHSIANLLYALRPYVPEIFAYKAGPYQFATAALTLVYLILVVLIVVWMVGLVLALVVVYVVVALDVATAPSLPLYWSRALVAYAGVAFAFNFIVAVLIVMPLPFRDYSLAMELSAARKRSKEEYEQRVIELLKAKQKP